MHITRRDPNSMKNKDNTSWWTEEYGYFGSFYIKADTQRDTKRNNEISLRERTKVEVDGIIRLLSLEDGMKILDCPCGYGRHSIELASRNFLVTGADINSKHLEKAKSTAGDRTITFTKKNMLDLMYDSEFDAVINIFASFGFFDTEEENEKVLQNFFNALKPGGKFLMHIDANISKMIHGDHKHINEKELVTGEILRIVDVFNPKTKRLDGTWTIEGENTKRIRGYSVRIYTKDEFERMCKKIGFSSVKTYSNWNGNEYTDDADNMIVVAQK